MSEEKIEKTNSLVLGIGGAGGQILNQMLKEGILGFDFAILNTDKQDLERSQVIKKVHIGRSLTKDLGAGGRPEIGTRAANDDSLEISKLVQGYRTIILIAGMGGGTGTGASNYRSDCSFPEYSSHGNCNSPISF